MMNQDVLQNADRKLQQVMMNAETCRDHLRDMRFKHLTQSERDQSRQFYRDALQALRNAVDEVAPPF